jgi:general secretion pathway protein A
MALYLQHFGLTEAPFSITPDPAFVYLSAAHREALAHLLYGVGKGGSGGFVQLTGEVGTGKTTICRCLLEQVPEDTLIALILNPLVTPQELLASICDELGVNITAAEGSSKKMVDALNQYLLQQYASGKRVVVVIDEAQNLSPEALEQVRLLTNLETAKHKLLQMVLLGQPELRQLLQRQNLRQLAQRITARYHLAPLNEQETFAYIKHRMRVAGARQSHFKTSALKAIYRRSGGVPRLINIIADRALAGAYAQEKDQVSAALVQAAANEVQPSESRVVSGGQLPLAWAALAVVLLGGAALAWQQQWLDFFPPPAGTVSTADQVPDEVAEKTPEKTPDQGLVQASNSPPDAGIVSDSGPEEGSGPAPVLAQDPPAIGSLPLRDPEWSYRNAIQGPELTEQWLSDQHLLAYPALAQLWQEQALAKDLLLACEGAAATAFACLTEHGNWAKIRKLGLPVILVLRSDGDKHVVLRGLSDRHILLGAGSNPEWFPRDQVDALWMGKYLVAWPQSPDWPMELRRGDRSSAVSIVQSMAALAEPAWQPEAALQASPGGVAQFDLQFENWIKSFQQREGLPADGIIGPQTLLYLMAPGIAEPRLKLAASEDS